MRLLLILFICLLTAILPIFHIRKILRENERRHINEMGQKQKRAYYFSLIGSIIMSSIALLSLVILVLQVIQIVTSNSQGAGYALAFLVMPSLFGIVIVGGSGFVSLIYSIPTVFMKKQRISSIWFILLGTINLFFIPLLVFPLAFGIDFLFLNTDGEDGIGITDLLFGDEFHPVILFIYTIFIGPLLLLIGGILSFLNDRKQNQPACKHNV